LPAIITHYLFACEALPQLYDKKLNPDIFIWGNQGPDLMFYALPYNIKNVQLNRVGVRMHRGDVEKTLAAMAGYINSRPAQEKEILTSYLYGFIAHYVLDRTFHPYVRCLQVYLKNQMPNARMSYLHRRIESALDVIFLKEIRSETISSFNIQKKLHLSRETFYVSRMLHRVILENYGWNISSKRINKVFPLLKRVNRMLYSPSGQKRRIFVRSEKLFTGRRYSDLGSITHPVTIDDGLDYANVNGLISTEELGLSTGTAFELFDSAMEEYLAAAHEIPSLLTNPRNFRHITRGINFEGKKEEERS
jgi:hypothetical protein